MIEPIPAGAPLALGIAPAPFPSTLARVPGRGIEEGSYRVRFARDLADLDAVLRLRFEVFNLELGEGLDSSYATGRDQDVYDLTCHHLIVEERGSGKIVGTYRLQTAAMADPATGGFGFYTASEYDLAWMPRAVQELGLEVGRACVAREHRGRHVLYLLWKGLALYLEENGLRYFFGCCSLTTQDEQDGFRALRQLERRGAIHSDLWIPAVRDYDCGESQLAPEEDGSAIVLPPLFEIYLRYGGKVASPPAIDRLFKTIDFLVLVDIHDLTPKARRLICG